MDRSLEPIQGLNFEKKYKKDILKYYDRVDFSCLPVDFEKAFEREDIPFLGRFVFAIECYDEFIRSYKQRTTRNIIMRDQFDLIAYMIRNSNFTLDQDPPLMYALDYVDAHKNIDSFSRSQLLCVCTKEKEIIHVEHLIIMDYMIMEFRGGILKINEFVEANSKIFKTSISFINHEWDFVWIQPLKLFESLPVEERLCIATGQWRTVNLLRYSPTFITVIKILFDIPIDRETTMKDPYLIARRGDILDIARSIINKSQGNEILMRLLAGYFAEISEFKAGEITRACILSRRIPITDDD
jgi:hypothetical protein